MIREKSRFYYGDQIGKEVFGLKYREIIKVDAYGKKEAVINLVRTLMDVLRCKNDSHIKVSVFMPDENGDIEKPDNFI